MFEASCHCGMVVLKTTHPPKTVTSCNCSICHRIGAMWGYYVTDEVIIEQKEETSRYSWGDGAIIFHSCPRCGCTTHYTSKPDSGFNRVAINTRMAPREITQHIPVRYFDGADTWKYIDE